MRQTKYPCCGKPMNEDDLWEALDNEDDKISQTCPTVSCPHCGKAITVYLSIDSVEKTD